MKGRTVILVLMIMGALFMSGCFPKADAGDDKQILVDLEVTLEGTGSELLGGPVTLTWDFGDGSDTEDGDIVTHQYAGVGTYTVTLTVTDNMRMTAIDTIDVEVVDWEVLPVPISFDIYSIDHPVMTFLPDGKMVILDGDTFEIIEETEASVAGARVFQYVTTLTPNPMAGFAWGSFLVAKDNNTVIAGTSAEIFSIDLMTGVPTEVGADLPSFDAALTGNTLYVTAGAFGLPGKLYSLDITTGTPADLVTDINGASGGVCLDGLGSIYSGNGYASGPLVETGEIRQFDLSDPPLWAWYTDGIIIANLLSASSLIWAADDLMLVGGGDWGPPMDLNYFAAVNVLTGNPKWILDPDDPVDSFSSYVIKADKTANMFSAISYGGDYYLLPFGALGF